MELTKSWQTNFHFTSFESEIKLVSGGCAVLAIVLTAVTFTHSGHDMTFFFTCTLTLLQYSVSVQQLNSTQVSLLVVFPFWHFMVE
jgi:hypothetical protein